MPCGEEGAGRQTWVRGESLSLKGESVPQLPHYCRSHAQRRNDAWGVGKCPRVCEGGQLMDGSDSAGDPAPGNRQKPPWRSQAKLHTSPEVCESQTTCSPFLGATAGWKDVDPPKAGQTDSGVSSESACLPRLLHMDPWRTPAFHDLLQFHLQGLDGSRGVITS